MTERKELYQVEDGWIELVSGTKFYFGAPKDHMIHVEDIAYSLSNLCRFNGHTRRFYSVAEHAVLLADYVANLPWSTPRDVLTALHHDDAEYIIGDLARPVKVKIPEFKRLEVSLDEALAHRFGTIFPFPDWMREFDSRILCDEHRYVMNPSDNDWGTDSLELLGVRFKHLAGRVPLLMRWMYLRCHYRWNLEMTGVVHHGTS